MQSLQQLQPGQQGHLLLKTENGQYQLLRVGPAPPQAAGGQQLTTAGSTQAGTATGAQQTTYRLQTVPAVSRLNTQFTGPPLTIRKTIVQQVKIYTQIQKFFVLRIRKSLFFVDVDYYCCR